MWADPAGGAGGSRAGGFLLPAGTVTFLLTDIEGSTRLWQKAPEQMEVAVAATYTILDDAITRYGGVRPVEQGEGDSVVAAFSRASDALAAALHAQRELHAHAWPGGLELRVRLALHTADAQLRDEGNYFGVALSRCARLRATAHGGQTLLSRATHDLVVDRLPEGAELVDCGVHRLRDLGRPEQVFALAHPDLPPHAEPLRSLDAFPNNLPDQLTSFIGRGRELEQIGAALEETRLLTLTGAGGAGKTRLALQVAADSLDRFPDGAWWVELAPLTDGDLVADTIAVAVGVRPLPGVSALQAACGHFAARRAMVVLDNCEHLVSACAEAAQALLRACPDAVVLATSRTPLGVPGETHWRVPPLALPHPEREPESIQALGQYDAVRLFVERARKARPNFSVTNENAPALAHICQELDGLPLAIELAAARVRMLSVEQIAAGLADRFHLLTGGTRMALPRHQTLRASVDWSHELLSGPERMLFRRLAVFAGGFTLDRCEEVGAGHGLDRLAILDLLGSLVDKSLVVAEEHGAGVRYRLLETVRQYAAERLVEACEEAAVRDRHRDAFLALAEQAGEELRGATQRYWLEVLDPEASNLSAAVDRAVDTDPSAALRMCVGLTVWWRLRGMLSVAERSYARTLAVADPEPSALRAQVLWARAWIATIAGRYEASVASAQEALEAAEAVDDESILSRAHNELGLIQLFPDPVGSRSRFKLARKFGEASSDHLSLAYADVNLAFSHLLCDEFAPAESLAARALQLGQEIGYREIEAWSYLALCSRPLVEADFARFADFAERALAASRDVGEPATEGHAQVLIGFMELYRGEPERSLARLEASRERSVAAGEGLALPWIEISLATARASLGELESARVGLEALTATGADSGRALAWAMLQLGDVLRVSGDAIGAAERAGAALEISERIGMPQMVAWSNELRGRLAAGRGDWGSAEALVHDALATRVELGLRLWIPQTLDALAEIAAGLASHEEAARLIGAAARARADLGIVRWTPNEPRAPALAEELKETLGEEAFQVARHQGAALTLEEAVAWLRRARGERRRPARGWESLTPTELQVVGLVAEGLTNPQIGERMFISRGTVKTHLSHVFAKLGIATRTELAAEAARRSPTAPR